MQMGSDALFLDLKAAMDGGTDTLVFIHGYNVSFRAALLSGAQLIEKYGGAHPIEVGAAPPLKLDLEELR